MKRLSNIKRVIPEIANKLLLDKKLLQLLIDDTSDLSTEIEFEDYTYEYLLKNGYINIIPIIETHIKEETRNTFLVIKIENINFTQSDTSVSISGVIYVTTNLSHSLINSIQDRALEIADLISQDLEGYKLSIAQTLHITSINSLVVGTDRCGYGINFYSKDQISEKAEI